MLLLRQTRQVLEPVCPGLRPLLRGIAGGVDLETRDAEKQQRQLVEEETPEGMTEGHGGADADAGASREGLMVEGEAAAGRRGREFQGSPVAFMENVVGAAKGEQHGDGDNSNGVAELSKLPHVGPSEREIQRENDFDHDAKASPRGLGEGEGEVFDGPGGGSRRGSGGINPLAGWIGGLQIV